MPDEMDIKSELIRYRIEMAESTLQEAEYLIDANMLRGASNRIYYSIFYLLLALALKHNFPTSKHGKLLGWFNKEFVHTGKLTTEMNKIVQRAYVKRIQGDYEATDMPVASEILLLLEDAKNFHKIIKENFQNL
ncbi:MAG: HEPN domain-containing protein [Bacteroidetes bacterium]|nr:HEPN domain-containing protein [Bacteroidota bacterium]